MAKLTNCDARYLLSGGLPRPTRAKRGSKRRTPEEERECEGGGGYGADSEDGDGGGDRHGGVASDLEDDDGAPPAFPVPDIAQEPVPQGADCAGRCKKGTCEAVAEHKGRCRRCCGCPFDRAPGSHQPHRAPITRPQRAPDYRDDLAPAVVERCSEEDPFFVVPPSGEGHKRLDAALKVLGDLLGTVVGPGARRCDLEFEVRDRRRAGVVLDGLTTGTGDADPVESLRRWSACTSTVSNAVLCLLEYLCAGSPYYSPQLRDVWKGVRAALNDKLSVPEDWDEEAKENSVQAKAGDPPQGPALVVIHSDGVAVRGTGLHHKPRPDGLAMLREPKSGVCLRLVQVVGVHRHEVTRGPRDHLGAPGTHNTCPCPHTAPHTADC